jgi:hypothetical protein
VFASKHAEAIYIGGLVPSQSAGSVAQIRAEAKAAGRDPSSLKYFVGMSPILGKTLAEAQAKYDRACQYADHVAGLAQFSGYTGIDLSRFPVDEVFELKDAPGDDAVHSFLDNFNRVTGNVAPWTPRRLGETMALGGFHPSPVGTPEMVADVFEQWINEADVDGFNISYITSPESFEDIVYLLRPELVKRGLMWEDYDVPGGTLRENLNGKGQKGLRSDHYGYSFKWKADVPAEKTEENLDKLDVDGKGEATSEVKTSGIRETEVSTELKAMEVQEVEAPAKEAINGVNGIEVPVKKNTDGISTVEVNGVEKMVEQASAIELKA